MSTPVADRPASSTGSPTSSAPTEPPPQPPRPERRNLRLGVALVALVALAVAGGLWWHYSGIETTDNAQVDGHVSPVAARVGGTVAEVLVDANEYVEAGAVLVRLDRRDYEVALQRAEADVAESEATIRAVETGVPVVSATSRSEETAAESEIAAAEARLASAKARLREAEARDAKARQDLERLEPLVAKDEISKQEYDATVTTADTARASRDYAEAEVSEAEKAVEAARARLEAARTGPEQVTIQKARADSERARLGRAKAALEAARLALAYTEIKAPVAGVVSRKSVEVGQVVQPGQPLLALVRLDDIWIVANFKENQLENIRPGQPVSISVDAYGGRKYRGKVESVAAATGSRFSLLPAENATGNYVKVVQRIPVRIMLEAGQDPEHLLRPGMSVEPTVHLRPESGSRQE
jgi:membrane fusion protein, multidrug efflux system